MAKDHRIVVRMDETLHAWLQEEASANGLDAATFVRMVLAQRRSGRDRPMMHVVGTGMEDTLDSDRYAPEDGGLEAADDVVARRLAEAEERGLARDRPPAQPAPYRDPYDNPPVRPLRQVTRKAGKEWMQGLNGGG